MSNETSDEEVDVAIIGAGPSGLISAIKAVTRDVEVFVFEEHKTIGLPAHCAGLVSVKGFSKLGFHPPSNAVLNKVRGAIFFSPSGHSFVVERKEEQAYVLDRVLFDRFLSLKAKRKGAKIKLACKVDSVSVEKKGIFVKLIKEGEESNITAKVLIDAEGVRSTISRKLGFSMPRGLLPAVQFEMINVDVDVDFVELYFGQKVAPGFFAWVIPTSDNSARVGLAAKNRPLDLLRRFIKRNILVSSRLRRGKIARIIGGTVITGGPISRTWRSRILLVGDVAGQVKPTTGGGIILGSLCSAIAGKVAGKFVKENLPIDALGAYEKTWRKLFDREFKSMKLLRQFLNILPDKTLDKLFLYISRYDFNEDIAKFGDMDFQFKTIFKSLTNFKAMSIIFLTLLSQFL